MRSRLFQVPKNLKATRVPQRLALNETRKSAWYFTGWWAKFHFRPLSPESNGDWTRITGCDHQPTNAQNMGIDPLHFHNKRRGVDSVNIGRRGTNLERNDRSSGRSAWTPRRHWLCY